MLNATLLVLASFTAADDAAPEPSAYEHLKDLQCFVGVWEAETIIPKSPANSKSVQKLAGKKLKLRLTFNWTPEKNAQTVAVVYEVPGDVTINSTALRGWDQAADTIKEYSFTTHLGVWTGTIEKVADKWVNEYEGVNLDGAECSGTRTYTFKGNDTMLMTDARQRVDGKETPNMDYHFKRVVPPTNHERLKGLSFLIGSWKATKDDGSITTWSFEWAQNKNVIDNIITSKDSQGNVVFSNKGTLVWDKYTQQVANVCFDKNGNSVRFIWGQQDDGNWTTAPAGSNSSWPVVMIDQDHWEMGDVKADGLKFKRQ